MALPLEDIQALGAPVVVEQLSTGTTVAYSSTIFDKGEVLHFLGNDGHEVKFAPELAFMGGFGNEWYETPLTNWVTDAEGALLKEMLWRTGASATAANFTLDKTRGSIAKDYVLEMKLDLGTADEIRAFLTKRGPNPAYFKPNPYVVAASSVLQLDVRHIERYLIVAGVNDDIDFTEGTTGAAVATIDPGFYTRAALATEITTQMNAVATDNTYLCVFHTTTANKFTISRASGADTIDLDWVTGPNVLTSAAVLLGYTADDTGGTTYDSDVAKTIANALQYQLRSEAKTAGYWDGSAWQATAQWIDITGSETEATFTDAITSEATADSYTLAIRPKGAYVGLNSHISRVGIHETLVTGVGARFPSGVPEVFVAPFRCRIAAIADGSSKLLTISRLSNAQ